MYYDITKPTAPTMPTLGKGTECIKLLLSQVSKDMHEPLVPMLFPILGTTKQKIIFLRMTMTNDSCRTRHTPMGDLAERTNLECL